MFLFYREGFGKMVEEKRMLMNILELSSEIFPSLLKVV